MRGKNSCNTFGMCYILPHNRQPFLSGKRTNHDRKGAVITSYSIHYTKLYECTVRDTTGEEIDSALVVFFPAPRSFTGEDVAEIHLHGNPVLVERAGAAACDMGASYNFV